MNEPRAPRADTDPRAGDGKGLTRSGVALARATALAVVALGAAASSPACSERRTATPEGAAGTTRAPAQGKPLRIGMIGKQSANPSFLSARNGAEDRARELSARLAMPIQIDWLTPSEEDARVQAQRIAEAVSEGVDAVLVSCADDQKVSDAIDAAVARGVAVMTFDSDAPRSRRFAYCGVDDVKVGEAVMAELGAVLDAPGRKPGADPPRKLQVAVLAGSPNAPNMRHRVEGALREAARHPNLKVVGTFSHVETPQGATAEMRRAQAAHPDIAGWAMMGGWPLYSRTLLGDLALDKRQKPYKIVAVNALPPQLVYIDRGLAPVLLAQPTYLWGAVGVETIVDKLRLGKRVPERIPLDLVRVTAANLGTWARQLKAWGFPDVPEEYLELKR